MPGLDYYGSAYDAYERDNPLVTLKGFAIFGGAELAGSKFGLAGLAERQSARAAIIGDEAAGILQGKMRHLGSPRDPRPRPPRRGSPMNRAQRMADPRYTEVAARGTKLTATSARNLKFAKSLTNVGRAWGVIGTATIGYELGKAMFNVGGDFRIRKQDLAEQRRKVYNDDTFMDSRAAFTQRQRAIQVIHNSQMGVRSAMGSEASYLHY